MFTPTVLLMGLAVLTLLMFLPGLLAPKRFYKELSNLLDDKNLVRLYALFVLIISFLFLSVHWKFTEGWMMLISILGWLIFIKGIIYLWFPEFSYKKVKYFKSETVMSVVCFVAIVLAALMIYAALNFYGGVELVAG